MCIVHSCTHWLRPRKAATPPPCIWAISQQRQTTSLCDPLIFAQVSGLFQNVLALFINKDIILSWLYRRVILYTIYLFPQKIRRKIITHHCLPSQIQDICLYVQHMHSCSLYIEQKIVLITHLHYSSVTCYSFLFTLKMVNLEKKSI